MTDPLTRWTEQHALLMVMAIVSAWLEHSPLLLAAMAAASFCALLVRNRGQFTPAGAFGLSNSLTLMRVAITLALLLATDLEPGWQSGAVLLLVCADGVDGWAARRFDTASTFGQVFDHESDALLLLTVCLLLLASGRMGSWILLPGALRYVYVLLSRQAQPSQQTTPGNRFTRLIGVTTTLGLAICWLPVIPSPVASTLAASLTLTLTGSFLFSTWRLYRPASTA